MPVSLYVNFNPAEWQGFLNLPRAAKAINDVYVAPAAKYMAIGAKNMLMAILRSPEGGISVTASGASARNLFVARLSGGGLHGDSHAVYEGPLTSGNYFMRAGSRPAHPPVSMILQWLRDKNLGHHSPHGAPALGPGRLMSRRNPEKDAAWAISKAIAKKGTSTAHKPLFPGGQRRYDYVGYAVQKKKILNTLKLKFASAGILEVHNVMVGFWKTGRYNKNSAYKMVRPVAK